MLVIDIETTGFLRDGGSIVEVGAAALDLATGNIETVMDVVCREDILTAKHRTEPFGWIFRNSSLTVEDVRCGVPMCTLLPQIQALVDDYPLDCTAYNRDFDVHFLADRGIRFGRLLPCPMKVATPVCKCPPVKYGSYKWPNVEQAWRFLFPGREYIEQHRAADDAAHEAKIVYELYLRGFYLVDLAAQQREITSKAV